MRIKNGDKFITKKAWYLNEGEAVYVTDVNDSFVTFSFGEDPIMNGQGQMDIKSFEEHFEKAKKIAPSVTAELIEEIMLNSDIRVQTMFDKCTIVSCKLPNGFVIVESSACVSPENYNEEMGVNICLDKIASKIWELEGYKLQDELFREKLTECDTCDCDCTNCNECCYDEDECLDTDLDCDDCEDYECIYNPNRK